MKAAKRVALILIGHFKPEWYGLKEEDQAAFAARTRRVALKLGVTPVIGYTLLPQGSFLEVWEAEDKAALDRFRQELDALGAKEYYEQVIMRGERAENWIEGPPGGDQAGAPQGQAHAD